MPEKHARIDEVLCLAFLEESVNGKNTFHENDA
jgi:hypothetical protein